MEKPIKPIEPKPSDFQRIYSGARNHLGEEIQSNPQFIIAYKKYQKDLEQYNKDIYIYEQLKFLKIIRYSSDKLVLKKYKIVKI